jgi:hypothetical protein
VRSAVSHNFFAHRIATHLDAVRIVYQPVEDAIRNRRIADPFVPAAHGKFDVKIGERT